MSDVTPLRVGCVGTGFIAGRHLAALEDVPDVDIVAIADSVAERAEATGERYGARVYDDGLALLETEEIDAVWLCVPPFAHGPLELAALDRGLPFFVEKPLALDLATAESLAAGVSARGLLTGVGYHWRYLDLVEQASTLIQDRPAALVQGSWLDSTPAAPWWSRRGGSGGQLIEQTTHLFDVVRLLVGEVESLHALESTAARREWPEADVPTASTVLLRFVSGALGTISSSCLLEGRYHVGLRLIAPGRSVELTERSLSDHELRVCDSDGDRVARSAQDPIAAEDRAFVGALRGEHVTVRAPYDDALRTHALACAADRSAREGTPLQLRPDVVHV